MIENKEKEIDYLRQQIKVQRFCITMLGFAVAALLLIDILDECFGFL